MFAGHIPAHPFESLMPRIAILATVMHAAFIALFLWADVYKLAIINVASVLAHLLAYLLIIRGNQSQGYLLMIAEAVAHAAMATFILGWNSGFYYYLLPILPVTAVNNGLNKRVKVILVLMIAVAYVVLDAVSRQHGELHALAPAILEILYYFNVVSMLGMLCFMAFAYYDLLVLAEASLIAAANTDPLTQLSNRRCFVSAVQNEIARMNNNPKCLTFVLCDIDHFKRINDIYGHEAGDAVLKAVADMFKNSVRASDQIARWGGEEFIFMLPDTSRNEAWAMTEGIRRKAEKLSFLENGQEFFVTLTFGIVCLRAMEKPEQAFARADANLYQGKRAGRNCVIAS